MTGEMKRRNNGATREKKSKVMKEPRCVWKILEIFQCVDMFARFKLHAATFIFLFVFVSCLWSLIDVGFSTAFEAEMQLTLDPYFRFCRFLGSNGISWSCSRWDWVPGSPWIAPRLCSGNVGIHRLQCFTTLFFIGGAAHRLVLLMSQSKSTGMMFWELICGRARCTLCCQTCQRLGLTRRYFLYIHPSIYIFSCVKVTLEVYVERSVRQCVYI